MSERGIYVVAYGDPARRCAERLIESVHRYMPGVPVAVASDSALEAADVSIVHADLDLGGRSVKTLMWDLAPAEWQQVLYLDADTELVADISFLFDALSAGWEMVITKDIDQYDCIHSLWRRDSEEHRLGWDALGSDCALQLAGGVVAFRRTPATRRFLQRWHEEWKVLARRDQGALLRAIYAQPVRMLVLGSEWNSFVGLCNKETACILHHRGGPARRVAGWREGRLDDRHQWRHLVRGQPKRVHIVCPETDQSHILYRLARALTEGTGWTMGTVPDLGADLNYGFPYLADVSEPFAAWFSHREDDGRPDKAKLWQPRAENAILRVTCAPMYEKELQDYGPTARILPPLDRDKFRPGSPRAQHARLVAGVAGYVYRGGRKGENLLEAVLQTAAGRAVDWQAVGRGWPVPTKSVPYAALEEFYQGLDVYVCTSLIEGVPYPPLEALACGVPVIIPRGVGLLDELPDMKGIIRYRRGDVADLAQALMNFAEWDRYSPNLDREALRAATEQFTLEGWVQGHVAAFADLNMPAFSLPTDDSPWRTRREPRAKRKPSKVDFLATQTQYVDHMAPIWRALPDERRGLFYVSPKIMDYARQKGVRPRDLGGLDAQGRRRGNVMNQRRRVPSTARDENLLVVVCSYDDMEYVHRIHRRGVYCEHGSGQSFGGTNPDNPGGIGRARESVALYIVPNEHAAARNREAYPDVPNVIVGCPKLDDWHNHPVKKNQRKKPVVCVSFHWDRITIPEARSAWSHFESALASLANNPDWTVIGHGHPREMESYAARYRALGIEPVYDFEDVMRRADVYVNDCSSTLYEFASTDRPVVVLNAPWYRRDVDFGLRFWEYADVGVQCDKPEDLLACISEALLDRPQQKTARHRAVSGVYKYMDGGAAKCAASAIVVVAQRLEREVDAQARERVNQG